MKDLLRIGVVGGFLMLGLYAAWRQRTPGPAGRRALNVFLIYSLLVSFGAGLLQRDFWPFSNWPLVAGRHGPSAVYPRLVAVDVRGREHDVDYRAWQPFVHDELMAWIDGRLFELPPADRDRAAAYLVGLAEWGRVRASVGRRVGYFDRFFGPLAAPYFLLHPKRWSTPAATPPDAFNGLRLYRETWNLDERRANPAAFQRALVFEYRHP
jgi:hypothetical protein